MLSDLVISEVTSSHVQGIYDEAQLTLHLGLHIENWMEVIDCRSQYYIPLKMYKEQRKAKDVCLPL